MKRKSLLLMMLLALFSAGAWAQTTYSVFNATAGTAGVSTSEGYAKLVDGSTDTKWCVISLGNPTYIEFNYSSAIVPTGYILTTGGDTQSYPGRNPKSWKIMASTSSSTGPWELLTEVTGDDVLQAANTTSYDFNLYGNGTAYRYFRFEISATGGSEFQLAELKLKKETNPTPIIKAKDINPTGATLVMYSGISGNRTLQYGTNSSFTSGTYTEETISSGTATKTLSGLTTGTTYYARVKNNNGGDWSNVVSFTPCVIIGSLDNATDNKYLPTYHYYNYSLSQQIYTAGEIGMAGTINSVGFYYSGTASSPSRKLEVYMSSTTLSAITAWTTENANNKVFDGTVTLNSGWNTITFSTPFTYDGTSNLLLTVYDKTGSYTNNCNFKVMSTTSNMAAYQYNDDENSVPKPTAASGTNNFTATNFKNILKLDITPSSGGGSSYITEITSVADWNEFCNNVNNGHDYSGETVNLNANLSDLTTVCGTHSITDDNVYKAFSGTFNGKDHTLSFSLTNCPKYTAPFTCVENATIQNLSTAGSLTGSTNSSTTTGQGKVLAGIVGVSKGTTNITGCSSSMAISSNYNNGDDVALSGIVASIKGGTLTVEGCAFEGSLTAATPTNSNTNHNGGIVGYWYSGDHIYVRNTIFAPTTLSVTTNDSYSYTIARLTNNAQVTIENCYYTMVLGNVQGKERHTITAGENVTVAMSGTETDYGASGIKAYKNGDTQLPGLVYNGTVIAGNGENVGLTLGYTGTLDTGYAAVYSADHGTLSGSSNPYTLAMDAYNTIISATSEQMPIRVGNGTNATYLTWEEFAANVQNTTNYSGKTIYLEKDITVTSIVPSNCWNSSGSNMVFKGTFDGQGHTITIYHTATQDFTGLFRYTYGATIKNLRLEGTITSSYGNTASVIGMSQGTNKVENVISNVTINSTATGVAGMIAGVSNTVYFTGCAFTGQLNGTGNEQNGGFVGRLWNNSTHSYTNCLFAPSSISSGLTGVATFDVYGSSSFTNCYYTQAFGTEQGIQAYSVTGASPVNVTRSGDANTTYDVSGIAAYTGSTNKGLNFTQGSTTTIYAGSGETVALTLSGASTYEADHGTLAGSGSSYSLTMAASNTIISGISCAVPTNLQCTYYNRTSATLAWTAGGDETAWQVKCWPSNQQEPGDLEGYTTNVSTNPYTLTNLTQGQTYHVKVRAKCDENNFSDWSNTITVTPQALTYEFTNADATPNNANWDELTNWQYSDPDITVTTLPTINDNVLIKAACTIPSGCLAQANEISILTDQNTDVPYGSITIEDGGQLQHNNEGVVVTVERVIEAYGNNHVYTNLGYKIISFPVVNGINPGSEFIEGLLTVTDVLNNPYDFYTFNYNNQEQNVYLEWMHVSNDDGLDPYKGYLYASQNGTTISVKGDVAPSVNQDYPLDYGAGVAPFNGWQLVGNPFVCNAYLTADNGNLNFYEIKDYDDYAEFSPITSAVEIPPMGGVMVWLHDDDNLVYSRTAPSKGPGILNMDVNKASMRGTTMLDRARVRFGEGRNLKKLQLNPRHTKLYIPEDGNDFSVYYAEGAGTIPVNFKAQDNGSYTLSFSTEDVSFNYLHLIDNMNGNDVDLLQTPYYTFDAKSTDFASRFTLVFATGNDNDDTFAFFNNGVWIINNDGDAELQVVDVLGHILSSETISGSCSKAINVAPGVYMLRLVNGNDVKVQKIVVR